MEWKEIWKPVSFDFEFTNECRFEVSNWGRVRSFNKVSNGNLLQGSLTEGYKVIRLKLYRHRTAQVQAQVDEWKANLSALYKTRREYLKTNEPASTIEAISHEIETLKQFISKKLQADLKKRTIYHHFLVHRLVATYFLDAPTVEEKVVAHLDYDKLNNRVENLKWMTLDENKLHQHKSPFVIAEKLERKYKPKDKPSYSKLTVTQVMLVKKELNRGVPASRLAKNFRVSGQQISRIKSGENWGHIPTPE